MKLATHCPPSSPHRSTASVLRHSRFTAHPLRRAKPKPPHPPPCPSQPAGRRADCHSSPLHPPLFPPPKKHLASCRSIPHTSPVPSSLNLVNTWCCSRQDCRSFPGLGADETRLRTRCAAVIPAETHRGNAASLPYIPPNHTARKAAVIVMAAPVRCIPTDIVLHHGRPQ